MDMNNNSISENIEIDLLDIIWKLLISWKPILVTAIILGLLLPSAKYYKDRNAVAGQVAEAENKLSDQELDTLEATLDDTAKTNLDIAVSNARSLLQKQRYKCNSFLTKLDPYNVRTLNLQYYITDVRSTDAVVLCESYMNQLRQPNLIEPISDALDYDLSEGAGDSKYVSELLDVSYSNASQSDSKVTPIPILNINFILPADADADACQKAIMTSVSKLQKTLGKTVTPHNIKLLSAFTNRKINNDLVNSMDQNQTNINNLISNLSTSVSAFSDDQKTIYESKVASLEEKYGVTLEGEEYDSEVEHSDKKDGKAQTIEPAAFSKKYAVLGFVLGIFLYACALVLLEIMGRKLATGDELYNATGVNCFGKYFSYPAGKKGILSRFLYSPGVYRLYHKHNTKLEESATQAAAKIATAVSLMEEKPGRISFLSLDELAGDCDAYVKSMSGACAAAAPEGVECKSLTESVETLSVKADLIRDLGEVVLVLQCGRTGYLTLENFLSLAKKYDIHLLGYVAVE